MRRIHRPSLQGIAVSFTLIAGPCGNCPDNSNGTVSPDPSSETLLIVSGDHQTVGSSGTITLSARVENNGLAVPGVSISWTAESGSVSPTTSVTDANGIGTTVWTLPAGPGSYRVFALYRNEVTFHGSVAGCFNPFVISDDFSTDVAGRWTTTGPPATPIAGLAPNTFSTTYITGNGHPGGYWQFQHVSPDGIGMTVYHRYDVDYDPRLSGNAIDHINYSEDQISLPPHGLEDLRWGFFLEQGGVRYAPARSRFGNTAWATGLQSGLTAAQFAGADLGPTGGPIRFGFYRESLAGTPGPFTRNHAVDNFRVEICRQ